MSAFEQYLISLGFQKMVQNPLTQELRPAGDTILSTLGCIAYCYHHEKFGSVFYGLNEYGKPPTLVSPRPNIRHITLSDNYWIVRSEQEDDFMNIVLNRHTPQEVFEAMFDRSKVFVLRD
jgi:hypothetical protein